MLLRIGSQVRYRAEQIDRMCAGDPTACARSRAWIGTIVDWVGRKQAVIQFDGHGQIVSYLDHFESAEP